MDQSKLLELLKEKNLEVIELVKLVDGSVYDFFLRIRELQKSNIIKVDGDCISLNLIDKKDIPPIPAYNYFISKGQEIQSKFEYLHLGGIDEARPHPIASGPWLEGEAVVGQTSSISFHYSSIIHKIAGDHKYGFFIADNREGANMQKVSDLKSYTWEAQCIGKYWKIEVTPVDIDGREGKTRESNWSSDPVRS